MLKQTAGPRPALPREPPPLFLTHADAIDILDSIASKFGGMNLRSQRQILAKFSIRADALDLTSRLLHVLDNGEECGEACVGIQG